MKMVRSYLIPAIIAGLKLLTHSVQTHPGLIVLAPLMIYNDWVLIRIEKCTFQADMLGSAVRLPLITMATWVLFLTFRNEYIPFGLPSFPEPTRRLIQGLNAT